MNIDNVIDYNIYSHESFYYLKGYTIASGSVTFSHDGSFIIYKYNGVHYAVNVKGLDNPNTWFEALCKKAKYDLERRVIMFTYETSLTGRVSDNFNLSEECVFGLNNGSTIRLKLDQYVRYYKHGSISYDTFSELNSFIWWRYG